MLVNAESWLVCSSRCLRLTEVPIEKMSQELHEAEMHAEWEQKREQFKLRRPSSLAERSPHVSVHTQALHGLGTSHL